MGTMQVDVVSLAAEFPNDNPALHRGVSWLCLEVTGAAVAVAHSSSELAATPEPEPEPELELEPEVPVARASGIVGLGDTPRDQDEEEDEPILVEDLPPLDETATLEGADVIELAPITTIAPPPPDDPWMIFVSALADIAIG